MSYSFMFWNCYFSYFILAFWERNISKLAQSMFTFMVIKQLANNLFEYATYRIYTNSKISKVTKAYELKIIETADPILQRELRLLKNVEE